MKKIFGLIMCLAFVFGALTVCGNSATKECANDLVSLYKTIIIGLNEYTAQFEAVQSAEELETLNNEFKAFKEEMDAQEEYLVYEKYAGKVNIDELQSLENLRKSAEELEIAAAETTAAQYAAAVKFEKK
jgi:flagellar motor component MotA